MCERYTITTAAEEIAARFSVDVPAYYKPRFNAAPSQLLPIITSENPKGVSLFYWGIPPDQSKNKVVSERIINLRSEVILDKPVYRKAIQSRRCIVPADGFYAWKRIGKKTTTPYRLAMRDRALFSFAGIWEEFEDINGEACHTFMIITTIADQLVGPIQERMPVILGEDSEKIWLSEEKGSEVLVKALAANSNLGLEAYTVSPRVNIISNDDRTLILPAPPSDQFGNLTLFG